MRTTVFTTFLLSLGLVARPATTSAAPIDFAHDIAPVLREHCGKCHTGDTKKGDFSLNTRQALLAGGESGAAVVPGRSDRSELVERLTTDQDDLRMPPEGPRVPPDKIALIKQWIDESLPWDDGFSFRPTAYEPPLRPRRVELPPAADGRDHPVDRLIDPYFARHGIERPRAISDAAFLRRARLDLVGLLPEPETLAEFLADQRSEKRQRIVKESLADDVAYVPAQK